MHFMFRIIAGAIALALLRAPADAQYPNRPITIIVPFAAGGPTDVAARIVGDHMGRTLGQPMIVENLGGAGGTLGMTRAMQARPDGYTIAVGNMGTQSAAPALYPNLKYDPAASFAPVLDQALNVVPQIQACTIKVYAIAAAERLQTLPNVPSTGEAGVDFVFQAWNGMVAPKETPRAIVTRLADALSKALDDPAVQRRFLDLGSSVPAASDRGPAPLQQLVETEIARITPVIKAAGATAE